MILLLHAKIVYNSTNYSAAPSGSILNLSLGQWTFPVAKSALSQWQPGRLSRNTQLVYKRYLQGNTKSTNTCVINTCQICVIESYDIVYTRQDCV